VLRPPDGSDGDAVPEPYPALIVMGPLWPAVREAGVLAGLLIADLLLFSPLADLEDPPGRPGLIVAAGVAGMVPLVLRHRAPLPAFGLAWVHSVVTVLLTGGEYGPTVGLLGTLYWVASTVGCRVAVGALLATAAPIALEVAGIARLVPGVAPPVVTAFGLTAVTLVAWTAGRTRRRNGERVTSLEAERAAVERKAVTAERRRVARELHDIVSHSVTVMVLQAAGAARIADSDPDRVREALGNIENTGVQAMSELRRMLGLLQHGDAAPCSDPLDPQPSLRDLDVLLASLATAGLAVEVRHHGVPARLDPSVDLTAYRIIQESLTNVLKHGGPGARPHVTLAWEENVLLLRIHDDGRTDPAPPAPRNGKGLSTGNGLVGLAARSAAVGGRLEAGRRPEGGYAVVATLPVSGARGDTVPERPRPC
jgi:signal transduction histidine kinase